MLINLPLNLENEEDVKSHFEASFYRDLSEGESRMLNTLINGYLARVRTNTCSREDAIRRMRENNPRFILRNYLLHNAIEDLEKGDDTLFVKLQQAIKDPYSDKYDEFFAKRPTWATQKAGCSMLSCSS